MKSLFTLFAGLFIVLSLQAQTTTISGTVTRNNEPQLFVDVLIQGTQNGGSTDDAGRFKINNVEPGDYNLIFHDFYADDTIAIMVLEGVPFVIDYEFASSQHGVVIDTFGVVGIIRKDGDLNEVDMIDNADVIITVTSGVAARRNGADNTADMLGQSAGVTVEGGKYVYVRGLSDRYSKTTLNGAEIPGLDPNRNAVQLDIFPSSQVDFCGHFEILFS